MSDLASVTGFDPTHLETLRDGTVVSWATEWCGGPALARAVRAARRDPGTLVTVVAARIDFRRKSVPYPDASPGPRGGIVARVRFGVQATPLPLLGDLVGHVRLLSERGRARDRTSLVGDGSHTIADATCTDAAVAATLLYELLDRAAARGVPLRRTRRENPNVIVFWPPPVACLP